MVFMYIVNENNIIVNDYYSFTGCEKEKAQFIGIFGGSCCFKPLIGCELYILRDIKIEDKKLRVVKFAYTNGLSFYFKH